ncbi:MAG: hypothetical protein K2Y37_18430 [Pirellulales bacterium]|nr:hypothetical protein [Pirellulales bacterium]
MLKKALIGGGVLALLTGFFFGRDACSYVRTSVGWVKDSVKDSVPVEFEIDRARKMVKDLVPDIRKNMHLIAREEVELERLGKQVVELEARLTKDKAAILQLKGDLEGSQDAFQYASHRYSREEVKTDLGRRFERFKTNEATLASLREISTARLRSLEGARQKLENMLAQKRQLEVEVENVEARLKMVQAAQAGSDYHFDDTRLGRVKELLNELRTKIEVDERLVGSETEFGEIHLDQPVSDNIVEQVTDYFSGPRAEVATRPEE